MVLTILLILFNLLVIIPLLFYLVRKLRRKVSEVRLTKSIYQDQKQSRSRRTSVQIVNERVVNYPLPGFSNIVRERVNVRRTPQDYATEMGWCHKGLDKYAGFYRVGNSAWRGEALRKRNHFEFYIIDPPEVLHGHNCFVHKGNGKFLVHWHNNHPRTLSEGIMGVEAEIARLYGLNN